MLLVNPTKYLGNLLLAGGLMQAYARHCQDQGIALRIVLDERFRELCETGFPKGSLLFFPRKHIKRAGPLKKIRLYLHFLKQLRAFRADLAFAIEDDPAASHLTRLSGAAFKLGCSPARHRRGFDHVVPVQLEQRDPARMHRWYSYYDVFAALGMEEPQLSYLAIKSLAFPEALKKKLDTLGWNSDKTTIALHAGATKDYKKWPAAHWATLAGRLLQAGMQPVLIGAGENDRQVNAGIIALVAKTNPQAQVIDLCNKLSLAELAGFLSACAVMVGNDSGPFHLGSALGVPGLVLWGPTNQAIWGPLGKQSVIVQGTFPCDPACNKGHCLHDHRCLREISPETVLTKLSARMAAKISN